MNDALKIIAQNIKQIRLNNHLTQKEFAKILGINSAVYYARLERGDEIPERKFSLERILFICSRFNVNIEDVITYIP